MSHSLIFFPIFLYLLDCKIKLSSADTLSLLDWKGHACNLLVYDAMRLIPCLKRDRKERQKALELR